MGRKENHSSQYLPRVHVLYSQYHNSREFSTSSLCFCFLIGYLSCAHPTLWRWKLEAVSILIPTLRTDFSASLVIRKSKWKLQLETCHRNPTPAGGVTQQQPCKLDSVICEINLAVGNKAEESGVLWATGNLPYWLQRGRFWPFPWWSANIIFYII